MAREKADIVLLGNDLMRFAETVHLGRRSRRIIWFNFAGTVTVDILGIAAAMSGLIGPVEAAMIHTGSNCLYPQFRSPNPGRTMIDGLESFGRGVAAWGQQRSAVPAKHARHDALMAIFLPDQVGSLPRPFLSYKRLLIDGLAATGHPVRHLAEVPDQLDAMAAERAS